MGPLSQRELELEVATLRKQNYDLTQLVLNTIASKGLDFHVRLISPDMHKELEIKPDHPAMRILVGRAVHELESRLSERQKLYRRETLMRYHLDQFVPSWQLHELHRELEQC